MLFPIRQIFIHSGSEYEILKRPLQAFLLKASHQALNLSELYNRKASLQANGNETYFLCILPKFLWFFETEMKYCERNWLLTYIEKKHTCSVVDWSLLF